MGNGVFVSLQDSSDSSVITHKQLRLAVEKYMYRLSAEPIKAVESTVLDPYTAEGRVTARAHARWLCCDISARLHVNGPVDLEQARQDLFFVQGILWSHGYYTIAELKAHLK